MMIMGEATDDFILYSLEVLISYDEKSFKLVDTHTYTSTTNLKNLAASKFFSNTSNESAKDLLGDPILLQLGKP
jgi:hypothetical protein